MGRGDEPRRVARIALVGLEKREDVKELHHARGRIPDPAHQLQAEAISFLLLLARALRAHIRRVLVVEMAELMGEHEDDGRAEDALELSVHPGVRGGVVRYAERFPRPIAPAREPVRPLVLEHGEVVGDGIDAVT